MNNLNPIRYVGGLVLLGLAASCNTSQLATQGETDNLYFMASDARVATEFAVKNNTPENFRNMGELQATDVDTESFSNRNVNPEYIAKYQRPSQPVEEGSVYFDDSENQGQTRQENGNVDAYDNFRGGSGNVTNNFFMNPMMGMGMGFGPMMGMGRFYDPFWGPGMGMMGMGMYDPFWGRGMGMMGFRPGFNMGFGMGFGFGSPFMRTGFGFGNPWMMGGGMGMGFYDPFMMGMGGFYRPGFYNPIIIMPGGEGGRQVVRSARPNMGSSLVSGAPRSRSAATQPSSNRSDARRGAIGTSPTSRQNTAASSRNNFSRSQNDYYSNPRASATPARRNISSPAVTRPSSASGTRSGYSAPARIGTSPRTTGAPGINNRTINTGNTRSGYAAPSRNTSPSYNRSTRTSSPAYNNTRSSTPSYNNQRTAPSRSTYSAPARSSSPSYSAPSGGGGSRGGGGGSVGGGRRGN
ncbi:hypothetical protein [Lunatibacter salilacus]|uniref:hypothetical protein n=1 Tax=Lunatibacter salilacus TaxID=2483804 RepID=UPI00131D30FE|nr:hypothetical protein [Lunatibacter salilacus]